MSSKLMIGALYLKLGMLEGLVSVSRRVLRHTRLMVWKTKDSLGLIPPERLADEIKHATIEEDYGCNENCQNPNHN